MNNNNNMFCKYRNIFGKVGQGVHSYRIFNIAIVDVLCTFLGAFVIQRIFFPKVSYLVVLGLLFLLGILLHRLFCVHTTIDKMLFGK
jgi:hypothetical protein